MLHFYSNEMLEKRLLDLDITRVSGFLSGL